MFFQPWTKEWVPLYGRLVDHVWKNIEIQQKQRQKVWSIMMTLICKKSMDIISFFLIIVIIFYKSQIWVYFGVETDPVQPKKKSNRKAYILQK